MFEHENFDVLEFDKIPLNRDCLLMDEIYIKPYEESLLKLFEGGEYKTVGYVSYIACRKVYENSIELSWYPNIHDRFHEVSISLPKDQLVVCVECWKWDEDPHLFIKSEWLEKLYLRTYSVFCMADAIGVKKALENGELYREKLIELRNKIDDLGKEYPEISFISFADSILIKSNWTVGTYKSEISYTYKPEIFIEIIVKLRGIYKNTLNLDMYAILTQGSNEYYDDALLHISDTSNHISLNSLGVPFADLMSIEEAVRYAIKDNIHKPAQLYMDNNLYNSLRFKYEFEKNEKPKYKYRSKMTAGDSYYFPNDIEVVKSNLTHEL